MMEWARNAERGIFELTPAREAGVPHGAFVILHHCGRKNIS